MLSMWLQSLLSAAPFVLGERLLLCASETSNPLQWAKEKKKTRKEQKVVRCGVPLCRPWLLLSTEDMLGAFLAFLCLRNVKRYHRIMTIYSLISYISWPKPTFQTSINFKTWQKIYTKQVSKYLRIVPDSTDPKIVMVIFFWPKNGGICWGL